MALQGTLETFSVPEVLRLLSGTHKTGLLELEGDRGAADVWLTEGRIVAARSDREGAGSIEAVLFDLLRFETGSFVFDSDAEPADTDTDTDIDVEEALAEAEGLLADWREIESVVPSLDHLVRLVDDLDDDSVTITTQQWRTIASIGGGVPGRVLSERLELGEFDVSRRISELVQVGLVEVTDEVVTEPDMIEPEGSESDGSDVATSVFGTTETDWSETDWSETTADDEHEVVIGLVDHQLSQDEVASLGQNLAGFVAGENDGRDDFLSQLSNFSPRAAAIEATEPSGSTTETTIDAAESGTEPDHLAADEPGAGPIDEAVATAGTDEDANRNLLLKFLSSARN